LGAEDGPRTQHLLALGFLFVELLGEVREANFFIALTLGHDAVVEGNVGVSAALFVNFKSLRRFVAYIQTFGIAFGVRKT
jgi:hypothetical protein